MTAALIDKWYRVCPVYFISHKQISEHFYPLHMAYSRVPAIPLFWFFTFFAAGFRLALFLLYFLLPTLPLGRRQNGASNFASTSIPHTGTCTPTRASQKQKQLEIPGKKSERISFTFRIKCEIQNWNIAFKVNCRLVELYSNRRIFLYLIPSPFHLQPCSLTGMRNLDSRMYFMHSSSQLKIYSLICES